MIQQDTSTLQINQPVTTASDSLSTSRQLRTSILEISNEVPAHLRQQPRPAPPKTVYKKLSHQDSI